MSRPSPSDQDPKPDICSIFLGLLGWGLLQATVCPTLRGQAPIDLPPLPPTVGDRAPTVSRSDPDRPRDSQPPAPRFEPGRAPGLPPDASHETTPDEPRPFVLGRPLEPTPFLPGTDEPRPPRTGLLKWPFFPTQGFAGPSGVQPREVQTDSDFVPREDRWRIGYPFWDRYDRGNRLDDDYPFEPGHLWDPFNQNVLKADYPIIGQNTFLDVTASANGFYEGRSLPTQTTPFESTARPFEENFFGRPGQLFINQNLILSMDLFHGDAAFKPIDWRIKLTPVFNVNHINNMELAQVSPNVLAGVERTRTLWTLQEWFAEVKLGDVSPWYDFLSLRVGSQPFISDFRGFLFFDTNAAVRLFGSADANRTQYNLAWFHQLEKNTNSFLNEPFTFRDQNLFFFNVFRQDFIVPGYTGLFSLTFNNDNGGVKFDKNRFLVRPDPIGIFRPHTVNVGYLGLGGEGHFGRYNLTQQFYWAFGRDTNNPIANRAQTINAQFYAIEGSYDRDWARFKLSFLWQSGDANPNNTHATGFDTILDNPNFAGGQFSYIQRQAIPLFGVFLFQRNSLVADLRSSKIQGQANFVNPGLLLGNAGVDLELTPKIKMFNNANLLWFDQTAPLETFLFDGHIDRFIGADLSVGMEYRPLVNENIVMLMGVATLIQGQGFRDLYNNVFDRVDPFVQGFAQVILTY